MKEYQRIELIDQDEESKMRRSHLKANPLGYKHNSRPDSTISIFDQNSEFNTQEYPKMPIKAVMLTLFLALSGLGFLIGGIYSYLNGSGKEKIITYILFGIFLLIPGGYYSVFLGQAYLADTPEERERLLNEVPI